MYAINTHAAPKPAGHYAQAIVHDGLLHMAAQLPIDPANPGRITPSTPLAEQFAQLLANCAAILDQAGATPADVLSLTLYTTDVENWDALDDQAARFFGDHRPARGVIIVPQIRKGFAVLASLTARVPDRGTRAAPTLYHVDAFTRTPFTGNSAGVVLDADGLSDSQMQALARELRHSETAFVLAPDGDDHDVRIRYFTPSVEVPICGHATIAAHFVRATALGLSAATLRQKTGAGIQTIDIETAADSRLRVTLHQGTPTLGDPFDDRTRAATAAALGLSLDDLAPALPIQIASTGHSKVIVPLADHVDLDGLTPDLPALAALSAEIGCNGYFPFKRRHGTPNATDGRMFAPAIGIDEDPVTGNANGPLGAYLVAHRLFDHDGSTLSFTGHQGRAIGRPGTVDVRVEIRDGVAARVSITGDAVILFKAEAPRLT